MAVHLVEEGRGGEGRTLGYAKFYLGEAAERVCERKIICTFFGLLFCTCVFRGFKGTGV
jgi:hypothetical protein